jgi:hypothetical protein
LRFEFLSLSFEEFEARRDGRAISHSRSNAEDKKTRMSHQTMRVSFSSNP